MFKPLIELHFLQNKCGIYKCQAVGNYPDIIQIMSYITFKIKFNIVKLL